MCLGLDGYLQSSVNGPDIVLQLPHLPTQSLYDCYKQTLKTHNIFYIMEKNDIYQTISKKLRFFGKKLRMRKKINSTEHVYVTQKNSNSKDGFAFPYIQKDNGEQTRVVVFAILNYECSLRLISMKKLEIRQYNDF